ncbi:MAG: ComEC/Rec2 family competence protein [Saprospiraceae bacterium]|nr:ComEC/Rec2 family competence protein [Saprospiraceae bacterium]MCB9319544.1 ComEC/Rec2 family competence protein [Lewinellaceae bacterium]
MPAKPRYPILLFTLPFLLGALLTKLLPSSVTVPQSYFLCSLGVLAVLSILAREQPVFDRLFWGALAITALSSGYWLLEDAARMPGLDRFDPPSAVRITGKVVQRNETSNGQFLVIRSQSVLMEGMEPVRCNDLLQIYVPGNKVLPLSSLITCQGSLQRQSPSASFEPVNWFAIREMQGINHIMWIRDTSQITLLHTSKLHAWAMQFNQLLAERIHLGVSAPSNQILEAMILGNKSVLDPSVKQVFRESGTAHVLAISGLHAGILYVFLLWIFRLAGLSLGYRGMVPVALAITGLWVYAFLTGLQPPILRTAFLLSLLQIGRMFFREISTLTLLTVIAVGFLLFDPLLLWNTGFELSFLAVGGILLFYPRLMRLVKGRSAVIRYLWGLTSVSIAAQALILPILLFQFHYFPSYFVLTSLFAVPLTGLILTGSFGTLLLGALIPWINVWGWKGVDLLTGWLYKSLNFFQQLPASYLGPFHIPGIALIPLTAVLLLFLYSILYQPRYPATTTGFLLMAAITAYLSFEAQPKVMAEYLDGRVIVHFSDSPYCYDWVLRRTSSENAKSAEEGSEAEFHQAYNKVRVLLPDQFQNHEIWKYRDLVLFNGHTYATENLVHTMAATTLSQAIFFSSVREQACSHKRDQLDVFCPERLHKEGYQWIE